MLLTQTMLKIGRPDSSQNFMDTAKTIDLTRLCIQINNTVVFANHIHIKLIKDFKKKNHVNNKSKVLSNTMFRISVCRTFIVEQSDSIINIRHQNCFS